jgi:hypothetical protein
MQLPSPEPAPAVASTDETIQLIQENMRLQATFSGFQLENDELQAEVEECHSKLKELQSRPVVRAEVEVESPAVQAVQALEPEPQMEDPKTKGWVKFKEAALIGVERQGTDTQRWNWEHAAIPLMRRSGGIPNLAGQEAGEIPGTRVDVTAMEVVCYSKSNQPSAAHPFTFKKPEIIENIKKGADEAAIGKSPFPSSFYEGGGGPIDVGSAFECRMTVLPTSKGKGQRWAKGIMLCSGFIWDRQAAKEGRDQPTPDEFIMAIDDHFPYRLNTAGQTEEWRKISNVEYRDVYIRPGVSLKILADKILDHHINRGVRGRHDQNLEIVVENEEDRAYLEQINPDISRLISQTGGYMKSKRRKKKTKRRKKKTKRRKKKTKRRKKS